MREFNLLTHPLIAGKNSLIEASAGTGKTTAIENLILRLLLEGIELPGGGRKEISLPDILIVTFTEAATAELIQRVRENIARSYNFLKTLIADSTKNLALENASGAHEQILLKYFTSHGASDNTLKKAAYRLRLALLSFDESAISTIHGFCSRMLNDFAFESNLRFNLELVNDDGPFIQETADDYWRSCFYGKNCALAAAVAAAAGLSPEKLAELLRQTQKSVTLKVDGEVEDVADAIKTLEKSCRDFIGFWRQNHLTDILENNAENFLADYKKKLNAGLQQIDKGLRQNIPGALFNQLNLFSAETLNGKLKKKPVWEINGQTTIGAVPEIITRLTEYADRLNAAAGQFICAIKIDFIRYAQDRNQLAEKKLRQGVQSFDDLLGNMHKALKDSPGFAEKIRRRFPVAMIDEFQDTDPVQFEIFQDIFNHSDSLLLMVGDPKQSIYAFRGADIYSYLAVSNAMPETATLNKNYRSSENLLHAFNALFDVSNPFIEETIKFFPAEAGREQDKLIIDGDSIPGKPMKLWMLSESALNKNAAKKLAVQAVCAEIVAILNKAREADGAGRPLARFESGENKFRPVRAGDIAVLTSSNKEALDISEQLAGCGIPAVLQHTGNVFESEEAISLFHLLRAIAEPGRESLLKTALSTPLIGLNSAELTELEQDTGIEQLEYWQDIFHSLFLIWKERGFIQMFSRLLLPENNRTDAPGTTLTKDIRCNLLSLPQGERRLTDLLHLSELIHQTAVKRKLSSTAIIAWLHEKIVHPEDCEEHERRLESDEDAVKVMTVHKSKGLQFPIVFCPFMWARGFYWSEYHRNKKREESDFFFHEKNPDNKYSLLFDAGHKKEKTGKNRLQYRKEKLAEQLRLLYVAVTRAKYYCCLTWGEIKETADSSLAYLAREWTPEALNSLLADGGKTFFEANSLFGPKFYEWKKSPYIKVETPDCAPEKFIPAKFKPTLAAAELSRAIASDWGLMSFSSLTSGTHAVKDQLSGGDDETASTTLVAEELLMQAEQNISLFAGFPGGTVSGNCIHHIFEQLDFRAAANKLNDQPEAVKLVDDTLQAFGRIDGLPGTTAFAASRELRRRQVLEMLGNVLRNPLPGFEDGFQLRQLPPESRLTEMEFYFPADKKINFETLNLAIKHLSGQLGTLESGGGKTPLRGFMNGKIDLTFEHNGKFYLADWKTNTLGASYEDYSPDRLATSMYESNYLLQAAIYALALHKYLTHKLPGYDYDQHFGGVFYLYVRGMNGQTADTGVYSLRPERTVIAALAKMFEEN